MQPLVRADNEFGKALVADRVDLVLDDADAVEAREDGLRKVDVLGEGDRGVVAPLDRVGGGDNSAARLQLGDNTGLGDGDGLLLHRLVD